MLSWLNFLWKTHAVVDWGVFTLGSIYTLVIFISSKVQICCDAILSMHSHFRQKGPNPIFSRMCDRVNSKHLIRARLDRKKSETVCLHVKIIYKMGTVHIFGGWLLRDGFVSSGNPFCCQCWPTKQNYVKQRH